MKKVLAFFLSVIMLMQLGFTSSAADGAVKFDENEWKTY